MNDTESYYLTMSSRKFRRRVEPLAHPTTVMFIRRAIPSLLVLVLQWIGSYSLDGTGIEGTNEGSCDSGSVDSSGTCAAIKTNRNVSKYIPGLLRPQDLPDPVLFSNFEQNTTVELPGGRQQIVAQGSITQINHIHRKGSATLPYQTLFSVLPQAVDADSVEALLKLLRNYHTFDMDPDTVDGYPTYEIFVDSPGLEDVDYQTTKVLDTDPEHRKERMELRTKLRAIMRPYLDNVLTPFVRMRYPEACAKGKGRDCTPCYSLIRRYRHGERQSHATHLDGHAIVTVVVSLSDHDTDYRGGLYVATGHGQRQFLGLNKGDAVVHQSTLFHGVKVYDVEPDPTETERWSWILWYKDSEHCEDHSHEWFEDCANQGNPACQSLHATKIGGKPGLTESQALDLVMTLNRKAALGGEGTSANKVARAYLGLLPSNVNIDEEEAKKFYRLAMESYNPEGHFGMAALLLSDLSKAEAAGRLSDPKRARWKKAQLSQALAHLESAALLGHAFSMFNLGVAHTFGYGTPGGKIDFKVALEWFEQSGLPEGYYVASMAAESLGDMNRRNVNLERAKTLGYFSPWRQDARRKTGSGGVGGVDLNLKWPTSRDGRKPPIF